MVTGDNDGGANQAHGCNSTRLLLLLRAADHGPRDSTTTLSLACDSANRWRQSASTEPSIDGTTRLASHGTHAFAAHVYLDL